MEKRVLPQSKSDRAEWKRKFILLNGKVEEIWQRLESVSSGNKVHEKRNGLCLSTVRLMTPGVVLRAISLAFFLDCWKMGNLGFQKGFFYCLFKNLWEKAISEGKHTILLSFHYQPLDWAMDVIKEQVVIKYLDLHYWKC